ncbi:tetratricopeptide repeat protein [Candidatus Uhrbacteria bacterium]|nr:tetratricopeptide repeat protein [Candidatus Uhrbacteria bacterium]
MLSHRLHRCLSAVRALLLIELFAVPLFFLPVTVDVLDLNKQALFLLLTFSAGLTWLAWVVMGGRSSVRGWLMHAIPWVVVIGVALSAWHSSSPFLSWIGGSSQEFTSVISFFGFALVWALVIETFNDRTSHRLVHCIFLISALLVAAITLLSAFGVPWPLHFAPPRAFNPIGSPSDAGIFLVIATLFASTLWISFRRGDPLTLISLLLMGLTFVYLLIFDDGLLWFLFIFGHALLFAFVLFRASEFRSHARMIVPIALMILAIPFWLWLPSPFSLKIPLQVTPSFSTSQQIAKRALEGSRVLLGSGPGTYSFLYARHHNAQVNQTDFFDTRFDRAFSLYLTLLPTIGYVGTVVFLLFLIILGVKATIYLLRSRARDQWLHGLLITIPWVTLVVAGGLFPFNFTLMWLLFVLGALLFTQILPTSAHESTSVGMSRIRLASSVGLTLGSLVFLVGIFLTAQRYLAEVAFARGVQADRSGAPTDQVVKWLDRAATLNRFDDRFYRALSQSLLLQLKDQLKGINNPSDLTDASRTYVQSLVAASVNAAVRATEVSPENSLNWIARGNTYRELISFVPNASTFAVTAFEKTIELEPVSPVRQTELGAVYLAVAEKERPFTASKDAQAAQQATALVKDNMTKAQKAFDRAIELKSNYAPAHYQLGLVYERQGRLDEAIGKMESVARYNTLDVGVAFELGQLYLRRNGKGDLDHARNALSYTVKLAPSYSNARWFLASVYEQQGHRDLAIEQIQKVLELNPNNQLVKGRLDRLINGQGSVQAPEPLP